MFVITFFDQMFMIRLMELIGADHSTRVPYERRELALEYIVQVTHVRVYIIYIYMYMYVWIRQCTCIFTCTLCTMSCIIVSLSHRHVL